MFVRFRTVRHRLVVDLVATRRTNGKVASEHIARLGSAALPEPISAAERILFWSRLRERWRDLATQLSNRVTPDERKKALAAIHRRIPRPTESENQAARIEAARAIIKSNEGLCANFMGGVEREREMIAKCEARIAKALATVDSLDREKHDNQGVLLRLYAGERINGDDEAMLDYVTGAAAKRDAEIRGAPRPAARGRRRRGVPTKKAPENRDARTFGLGERP
jgi:hypothetical protein